MAAPLEGRWKPDEIDTIREKLETSADVLRDELSGTGDQISIALDQTCLDDADTAARDLEIDHDVQQAANAQGLLDQTERALDRLRLGYYGMCERCGRPIPSERLEAAPRVTLCVPCLSAGTRR
jgi:RNA polymerase-binding protein DksA